jgi:hypothetical protein
MMDVNNMSQHVGITKHLALNKLQITNPFFHQKKSQDQIIKKEPEIKYLVKSNINGQTRTKLGFVILFNCGFLCQKPSMKSKPSKENYLLKKTQIFPNILSTQVLTI